MCGIAGYFDMERTISQNPISVAAMLSPTKTACARAPILKSSSIVTRITARIV
jgi:hypothetical protein